MSKPLSDRSYLIKCLKGINLIDVDIKYIISIIKKQDAEAVERLKETIKWTITDKTNKLGMITKDQIDEIFGDLKEEKEE